MRDHLKSVGVSANICGSMRYPAHRAMWAPGALFAAGSTLLLAAPAFAADLGVKKPSAVEYVRTCPTYGAGFFTVPGTTSCLKIVGRIRSEFIFDNPTRRADINNRIRVRGYYSFDHRVATEYGLLRTFARAYYQRENGTDTTLLEFASVQLGNFTFGRVVPTFEHSFQRIFSRSGQYLGGIGADLTYVTAATYTQKLFEGYTATFAVENQTEHRAGLRLAPGVALAAGQPSLSGGQQIPDFVLSIDGKRSWGELKLAGAFHEVRGSFITAGGLTNTVASDYGYAFTAGIKVLLPFLAKGSHLWTSFAYGSGAAFYTHDNAASGVIASRALAVADATVNADGSLSLARSWSIVGGIEHLITPSVSVGLGAFYGQFDAAGPNNTAQTFAIVGQLAWRPLSAPGLVIGGEAGYRSISYRGTTAVAGGGTANNDVIGRIRVQRDF